MDDKSVYVIQMSDNQKNYYDMNSGLLVGQEITQDVQGQKVSSLTKYDNYKEVKGVKYPMTIIPVRLDVI